MKGVIAAGSKAAVDAGADILARGGNAVSSAVAACFTTLASEPSIASLSGGGVILIYNREKKINLAINFFANMPGLGLKPSYQGRQDFVPVEINFQGAKQIFKVGRASAAPSGALFGFCDLAMKYGNLPLEILTERAISHLRDGVKLSEKQKTMCEILKPIYKLSQEASDLMIPKVGGKDFIYRNTKTADFLEKFKSSNWQSVYKKEFCEAILENFGPKRGGLITKEDLEAFKMIKAEPLAGTYGKATLLTAPSPAFGGDFLLAALKHLERVCQSKFKEEEYLKVISYLLHSLSRRKAHGYRDFSEAESMAWVKRHFEGSFEKPFCMETFEKKDRGCTTHVSVIDHERTAVSVTFSHGEGGGYLIGDTGIMMNNFIGEDDVAPSGFDRAFSGERLGSMIAPSILETSLGNLYALGSGGSSRIRSAIFQVLINLLERKMAPKEAVFSPRIHVENGCLYSEYPIENKQIKEISKQAEPLEFHHYEEKHLYFGGVHLVKCDPNGEFDGVGDPRRGGAYLIVK